MSNINTTRISVVEYDITVLSNNLPGSYSHIGLRWSVGSEVIREINFGSSVNGVYDPVGLPLDPRDSIGYVESSLGLPSREVKSIEVDQTFGDYLYNAVVRFGDDLLSRNVGYAPVPNHAGRQGNSNSAARYAAEIVGLPIDDGDFNGNAVGVGVDLEDARCC